MKDKSIDGPGYTPGPWKAEWQRFDKHIEILTLGGYDPLAWVDYDDVDHAEAEANARLIANAPALVEALRQAREAIASLDEDEFGPILSGHGEMLGFVRDALLAKIDAVLSTALGEMNDE